MSTTSTTASTFGDLGVPEALCRRLDELGLSTPFPIQALTLTDALAGRDVCGEAPTGSGKTLAFALPVAMTSARGQAGAPRSLLLVPTRELASQVHATLAPLAEVTGHQVRTVYGGTNINRDLQRLNKRVDVLIATPGRLEDLVNRRAVDLRSVDLVVIDEADRMADMGFLPVVTRLLDATSSERRTLLFSATLDGDVERLITRYQDDPAVHRFAAPAEERGDVRHLFWAAERTDRRALTRKLLARSGPTIVFTRTKHGADRLAKQLRTDGVETAAIHGNRSQRQREQALARFGDGHVQALIATDVAARGIHVDDVDLVVHFDQPATDKDYVHRSGRTGRAGATGTVVSFVGAEERTEIGKRQRRLSLPDGLHTPDVAQLDGAEAPAPTIQLSREGRTNDGGAPRNRDQRGATGRPNGNRRRRARRGGRPAQR